MGLPAGMVKVVPPVGEAVKSAAEAVPGRKRTLRMIRFSSSVGKPSGREAMTEMVAEAGPSVRESGRARRTIPV